MKSVVGLPADAARTIRPFTTHKVELYPLNKEKYERNLLNRTEPCQFCSCFTYRNPEGSSVPISTCGKKQFGLEDKFD